jgi:hypothetical protein
VLKVVSGTAGAVKLLPSRNHIAGPVSTGCTKLCMPAAGFTTDTSRALPIRVSTRLAQTAATPSCKKGQRQCGVVDIALSHCKSVATVFEWSHDAGKWLRKQRQGIGKSPAGPTSQ